MTPFDVFKFAVEMKKHFSDSKFNFHNKSLKFNKTLFDKRHDKYFFEKLAKYRDDEIHFIVLAQCLISDNWWIRDCVTDVAVNNGKVLQGWIEGIDYWFPDELKKINKYISNKGMQFVDLFKVSDNYPIIIQLVLNNQIFFPTFYLLCRSSNIQKYYDRCFSGDLFWESLKLKLNSLDGFIEYEISKLKQTIKNIFKMERVK